MPPLLGAQVQSWLGSLGPACLEWSGLPFPSPGDLPDPRDRTWVSCITGRVFTVWASRKAPRQRWIRTKKQKNGEDCMISWRDLKWHELIHLSSKVSEGKKWPEFWWLWRWNRFIVCKGEVVHGQSQYGSKMMSLWFWQKIKLALFCEKANRLSYYSSVT